MPRDVRYTCKQHGPFLVATPVGPGRKTPSKAQCPQCLKLAPRTNRRKSTGRSISVRGDTYEKLVLEADRRGASVRSVVEDITKDIV